MVLVRSTSADYFPSLHSDNRSTSSVRALILLLCEIICCGYSLEAPCRGASNEYQHMFSCGNKNINNSFKFDLKEMSYFQEL